MTIEDQSGLKYLGDYLNEINNIIIESKDNSNDKELTDCKTTNENLLNQLNSLQNEIKNKSEELNKISIKSKTDDGKQKRINELIKINENISHKIKDLEETGINKNEQYEKKISYYLNEIADNKKEIENLNKEKNSQLSIINDLNRQLEDLKQQISIIPNTNVAELELCQKKLNELETQISKLNYENNSLNEQITNIQNEKSDLLNKIQQLEINPQIDETQINNLKNELIQRDNQIQNLEKELQIFQQNKNSIETLQNEIKNNLSEIGELKNQLRLFEGKETENRVCQNKIDELENKLKVQLEEFENKIVLLKSEKDNLDIQNKSLEENISVLNVEIEKFKTLSDSSKTSDEKIISLSNELEKYKNDNNADIEKIKNLEIELKNQQIIKNKNEKELEKIKNTNEKLLQNIKKLAESKKVLDDNTQRKIQDLTDKIQQLEISNQQWNDKNNIDVKIIEELNSEMIDKKNELKTLQDEIKELKKLNENLTVIEDKKDEMDALREQISNIQRELDQKTQKNSEISKAIQELEDVNQNLISVKNELQNRYDTLNQEYENIKKSLVEKDNEINNLKVENNKLKEQLEEFEKLKLEISLLKEQLANASIGKDDLEKIQNNLLEKQKELLDKINLLETENKGKNEIINSIKDLLKEDNEEIPDDSITGKIQDLKSKNKSEDLQISLNQKLEEEKNYKDSIQELEKNIKELQNNLEQCQNSNNKEEMIKLEKELEEFKKFKQLAEDSNNKIEELNLTITNDKAKILEIEEKMKNMKKDYGVTKSKANAYDKEMKKCGDEKTALNEQIRLNNKKIDELQANINRIQSQNNKVKELLEENDLMKKTNLAISGRYEDDIELLEKKYNKMIDDLNKTIVNLKIENQNSEEIKKQLVECEKNIEEINKLRKKMDRCTNDFKKFYSFYTSIIDLFYSKEEQEKLNFKDIDFILNEITKKIDDLKKSSSYFEQEIKDLKEKIDKNPGVSTLDVLDGGAVSTIMNDLVKTRLGEDLVKNIYGSKENFIIRVIKYAKYLRDNKISSITINRTVFDITDIKSMIINFTINKFGQTKLQNLFELIFTNGAYDNEIDKIIVDNDTTDDKIAQTITNPECSKYIWKVMNNLKMSLQGNNKYLDEEDDENIVKYLNNLRKSEMKLLSYALTMSMYNKNASIMSNLDSETLTIKEMERLNKLWNGKKYPEACKIIKMTL